MDFWQQCALVTDTLGLIYSFILYAVKSWSSTLWIRKTPIKPGIFAFVLQWPSFIWIVMKFLALLAVVCVFAGAEAQVRCRNPGSVEIPISPCCDQVAGRGLGGALNQFFNLMDLECKINMFFQAIIDDPDMLEFFNYITGPEFRVMILAVQNLQEFKDFMWYMCSNLDLDVYLYLNTLGDILGIPRVPQWVEFYINSIGCQLKNFKLSPQGPNCHPDFPFPWVNSKTPSQEMSLKKATPYVSGVRRL